MYVTSVLVSSIMRVFNFANLRSPKLNKLVVLLIATHTGNMGNGTPLFNGNEFEAATCACDPKGIR